MPTWAAAFLGMAAIITALGVIWKQFIFPAARIISRAENMFPVLQQIAREFNKNGGSTLKDQLNRMEEQLDKISQGVFRAQETADRSEKLVVEHLQQGRRKSSG